MQPQAVMCGEVRILPGVDEAMPAAADGAPEAADQGADGLPADGGRVVGWIFGGMSLMGGMGRSFDGSYAEYTLVPARNVFKVDTTFGWEELAAIRGGIRIWIVKAGAPDLV